MATIGTTTGLTARRPELTGVRALVTLADLGLVSVAAGVILRRKPVVALLEKVQADGRALWRMRALRAEFGRGPVELVLPGRRVLVITDPDQVTLRQFYQYFGVVRLGEHVEETGSAQPVIAKDLQIFGQGFGVAAGV